MKKAVTTVDEFRRAVERLEQTWHLAEHLARAGFSDDDLLVGGNLVVSDPKPAASRGRGKRVLVEVATMWNQPPFGSEDDPLGALRRELATWPGVEAVGAPDLDPLLGALWGFPVTLRLSQ
ncbi:hypothetical protein OV203_08555 [Nannocystis sp. ILAH1]|uniref:hypothetical protein n=1 Tax=unclassified Nannocystis TaxID=2627009 RepID=UPI00226D915B|nr:MULTISPECIES: hypothetical protein [unclassified Nannocystis]MCY0987172.1 hypothetical protein [Nannocystis sp. ILAH1]MCY1072055.1 hypothetical protein [Nannocystis sp. RBIL2]